MRLTFEGSTLENIFQQMADALGVSGGVGAAPQLAADPAQVAKEATKEVDTNEKVNEPLPAAKKVLDEAGIPEAEYPQINHSGKGGRITKADATMYVNAKRLNKEREEKEAAEEAVTPPAREFPAAVPPAAEQTESPAAEPADQPAAAPVEGVGYPEANSALQSVYNAKGMAVTRAVLARFGAERLSKVSEDRYPEFTGYCNAVAAGEVNPLEAEQ